MRTLMMMFALMSVTATAAAQANRFTAEDVFQLERAVDPQISPDGSRIVYVRSGLDIMTDRSRSSLWIVNVDGSPAAYHGPQQLLLAALVARRLAVGIRLRRRWAGADIPSLDGHGAGGQAHEPHRVAGWHVMVSRRAMDRVLDVCRPRPWNAHGRYAAPAGGRRVGAADRGCRPTELSGRWCWLPR